MPTFSGKDCSSKGRCRATRCWSRTAVKDFLGSCSRPGRASQRMREADLTAATREEASQR